MKKHIIDEFAEVRAERRKWTLDEEAICRRLLRTGADLVGDEYVATLQSFERQELDRELCSNSDFGSAAVARCELTVRFAIRSSHWPSGPGRGR